MKSLNSKLLLSALGIALLATPTFAKSTRHRHLQNQAPQYGYGYSPQYRYNYTRQYGYSYTPQYGDSYTPQYVPGFGNIGATGGVSDSCC